MALYDGNGNTINITNGACTSAHSLATVFPQLADSGYEFVNDTGSTLPSALIFDFGAETDHIQSVVRDCDTGRYYVFNKSTSVKAYDAAYNSLENIVLPSTTGHNNDGCYYNGKIYKQNGTTRNLYVWDIANNAVSTIDITGVVDPENGSSRDIAAICETSRDSGLFYLVGRDVYDTDITHQDGDKLSVYLCNPETGVATLTAEFDWDCVYVQGCTCVDGILYVACNTQTTGSASNYKGITIKVINTVGWQIIDELTLDGSFEPEGMDSVRCGTETYIHMGMAKYGVLGKVIRFKAPY